MSRHKSGYRLGNKKNHIGILALIGVITLIFLYGALCYPHGASVPTGSSLEGCSWEHWLGTDNLGVDVFAQISLGYFRSIGIGLVVAFLTFFVGGFIGIVSGYKGGKVELFASFVINIFLSIPQLPIMIVIGAFVGQRTGNIIIILAVFSWAQIAKQVGAKTKAIVEKDYIVTARKYGGNLWYVFKIHMASEVMPLLLVLSIGVIGKAIVAEASLSFLGLSDPTAASWGMMMKKAMSFSGIYYTEFWKWWLMSPVLALIVTIVCFRTLAKSLERYWLKGIENE